MIIDLPVLTAQVIQVECGQVEFYWCWLLGRGHKVMPEVGWNLYFEVIGK